jgi:hypothetical protein
MALLLGGVLLDGFEVNARIGFGGQQALAIHKLPGGVRVIDAMGPDDHDIVWSGVLSGADASSRARALDALRVAGNPVRLAWDVFAASVIVSDVRFQFRNSWWIPYQLHCTVLVGTEAAPMGAMPVNVLGDVLADLGQAASIQSVQAARALVGGVGATSAGSLANAAAGASLAQANAAIAQSITIAEAGLQTADIPDLVQAAGSLAALTAAAGYVGRATTNFAGIVF